MATIKGQNIRLLIGGYCVGASTNCTLTIGATATESTTKDSTGDWAQNEITQKSWSASVDALVTTDSPTTSTVTGVEISPLAGWWYTLQDVDPGCVVLVTSGSSEIYIYDSNQDIIASGTNGRGVWFNNTGATEDISINSLGSSTINLAVFDPSTDGQGASALMLALETGEPITCEFSHTSGAQNRVEDEVLFSGTAIVTDFSIQAQNQQDCTFTASLTGTGELTLDPNNEF